LIARRPLPHWQRNTQIPLFNALKGFDSKSIETSNETIDETKNVTVTKSISTDLSTDMDKGNNRKDLENRDYVSTRIILFIILQKIQQ
jgi:hypothetical protein